MFLECIASYNGTNWTKNGSAGNSRGKGKILFKLFKWNVGYFLEIILIILFSLLGMMNGSGLCVVRLATSRVLGSASDSGSTNSSLLCRWYIPLYITNIETDERNNVLYNISCSP